MDVREKLAELILNADVDEKLGSYDLYELTHERTGCAEYFADYLIAHGVTVQCNTEISDELLEWLRKAPVTVMTEEPTVEVVQEWIPASEPPTEYRDKYGELIPFLVCLDETEYPFRAMYDGKVWGDGFGEIPVTYWMPLPQPPKGE